MKIFFSFSEKQILKHQKDYKQTREIIRSLGHTLTGDWLDKGINRAKKKKEITSLIRPEIISSILASDLIILDATMKSAGIGFQLAYSLEKEKPVLFLSQDPQQKLNKLFAQAAESPLLTVKSYNQDNLKDIITDYLTNNGGSTRVRFNLVMDKKHDNYIEWAAFTNNKSKTEIIKQAINKFMELDQDYQKYLLKD